MSAQAVAGPVRRLTPKAKDDPHPQPPLRLRAALRVPMERGLKEVAHHSGHSEDTATTARAVRVTKGLLIIWSLLPMGEGGA